MNDDELINALTNALQEALPQTWHKATAGNRYACDPATCPRCITERALKAAEERATT